MRGGLSRFQREQPSFSKRYVRFEGGEYGSGMVCGISEKYDPSERELA